MTQKGPKGPPSHGGNWAKKYAPGADLAGSQRRSADVSRGSLRSIAALGPLVLAHDRVMRGDRVPARSEFFLEKLRLYLSRSYWSEVRPGPQDRAGAGEKSTSREKKKTVDQGSNPLRYYEGKRDQKKGQVWGGF